MESQQPNRASKEEQDNQRDRHQPVCQGSQCYQTQRHNDRASQIRQRNQTIAFNEDCQSFDDHCDESCIQIHRDIPHSQETGLILLPTPDCRRYPQVQSEVSRQSEAVCHGIAALLLPPVCPHQHPLPHNCH